MDEKPFQLLSEAPEGTGQVEKIDNEYKREGTCSIFIFYRASFGLAIRECLGNRRIPSIEALDKELSAWVIQRNINQKGVDWHFTTTDARTKLKRLYPAIL